MKLTWLGHSGFRMEIGGLVLLIDPWMEGNPLFPEGAREAAVTGATHILLTHGHGDHTGGAQALAGDLGIPVVGQFDLMSEWEAEGIATVGFNKGGTVDLGGVQVTMVHAVHSSGTPGGSEAGYVIRAEGRTVYVSGDTDVMMDMELIADRYAPDVGILAAGGHFTMDMAGAAYAAKRFFDFKVVVPCHYRTFPLLEQSADALVAALPEVRVVAPEVMEPIEL